MLDTYVNPVYPDNFPDPFVLKWCGEYWAYCTGQWRDGRCFGVLRSRDLVRWTEVGGALEPLPGNLPNYWAPEVSYYGGRFYMYYSAGFELSDMALRVAVADHPAGPFVDTGRRLTGEPFAIDAHVFADDDGARYLFYATDYLEHSHVGTGTAVDRLTDPLTVAGHPRPVTRARFDWQVYDPKRAEKGGVPWHTVEGPFVLKRKGRYYQMFSAGNWQHPSYGVSYAVSDRVERAGEWEQHCDGEQVLPILRTVPGEVVGPGHNSVVRGPDNRQLVCVYHRWVGTGRAMAIDPLDWAGERMLILGPSAGPRPAPSAPAASDFFELEREGDLGPGWVCRGGRWRAGGGAALQESALDPSAARHTRSAPCFLAEVSARALDTPGLDAPAAGSYGISLEGAEGTLLYFLVAPRVHRAHVLWRAETGWREEHLPLPGGFAPERFQLLRAEVDGPRVRLALGEGRPQWCGRCAAGPVHVALRTSGRAAAFAGFALTPGFEDLFDEPEDAPEDLGWAGSVGWTIAEGELCHREGADGAALFKCHGLVDYELVVNARALAGEGPYAYGIHPAATGDGPGPLLAVERGNSGWEAVWRDEAGERRTVLGTRFDPASHQQWRFTRRGARLEVACESYPVGAFALTAPSTQVGLAAYGPAAFEMVRATALNVER
jgi:GH43 family beta-xylosidase